jgi:hypothetical protein
LVHANLNQYVFNCSKSVSFAEEEVLLGGKVIPKSKSFNYLGLPYNRLGFDKEKFWQKKLRISKEVPTKVKESVLIQKLPAPCRVRIMKQTYRPKIEYGMSKAPKPLYKTLKELEGIRNRMTSYMGRYSIFISKIGSRTTLGIENFEERYNALRRPTKLRILAPTDEGGVSPTTVLARLVVRKNHNVRNSLIREICMAKVPQLKQKISDEEWAKAGYKRLTNPREIKITSMWNKKYLFFRNYINHRYPGPRKTCRRCKERTHCYVKQLDECEHISKEAILQETELLRTTEWTKLPRGFKKKLEEDLRRLHMDSI